MLTKVAILVVISFLVVALIYSSSVAYARISRSETQCTPTNQEKTEQYCCYTETHSIDGKIVYQTDVCATCVLSDGQWSCSENTNTLHPGPTNPIVPPPSAGVKQPPPPQPPKNAPLPSTQQTTCPDGSTPDAKGNCPTTTNQQVAPTQNLASNNPQPEHHHHKGQDSTTKKDNNGGSQQQAPP